MTAVLQTFLTSEISALLFIATTQSAIFALLAWIVAKTFCRNNPHRRASIYAAALTAILLVPAITLVAARNLPMPVNQPIAITAQPGSNITATVTMTERANPIATEEAAPSPQLPAYLQAALGPLLLIWLVGVASIVLRNAIARYRLARIINDATPVQDEHLLAIATKTFNRLKLRRHPSILTSRVTASPFVTGLAQVHLIIPVDLSQVLDRQQLEGVLIHEAAHVHRRDLITGAIANLLCTLLWICPWIHLLNRKWAIAREEACDAWALRTRPATEYARTLLAVGRLASGRPHLPALMTMASHDLQTRIELALSGAPPTPAKGISVMIILPLLAATAIATTPIVNVADDVRAEVQRTTSSTPTSAQPIAATPTIAHGPAENNEAPQILIETKFVEISEPKLKRIAQDHGFEFDGTPVLASKTESLDVFTKITQTGGSDILSAPNVITLNSQTAVVKIGEERHFPESWKAPTAANKEPQPVFGEPLELGVSIEITPTVTANDHAITLDLAPKVVEFQGFESIKRDFVIDAKTYSKTVQSPVIAECSQESQLRLKPGNTAILNGMSLTGEAKDKRSVLVFVTATIIKPDGSPQK